ncbi:hypothetical protein F5887DRAFT_1077005 [Amanita rubescens]|nr:hypothetical protein F5887DRAFT_1077005 [Amanita rubescens]
MLPEFQTVLSYFQAQADILQHDYGDILRTEMRQLVDEFIDAATNLCQKISPKSPASSESGESQSTSVETQMGTESELESLPEVVMEFHRWAQGPPPSWLQEFEQFRSKTRRTTEADTESITEPDTEFERLLHSKTRQPATDSSVTEADTESVTEPDTEFERLLHPKTRRQAATTDSSITETDTESITEPDTEFERLLRSKTQPREESITEPDTESERLLRSKTQPREESITESDTESVTEPDTEPEWHLRPKTQLGAESVNEPDTNSAFKDFRPNTQPRTETTNPDYYSLYRAAPAEFTTTIMQLIDQLYDLHSSASRTVRELRALASGAEFCCVMFLFMLVFIRINGQNTCGPENEGDFSQVIKLSARRLFEALDRLQAFVAVDDEMDEFVVEDVKMGEADEDVESRNGQVDEAAGMGNNKDDI